MLYPQATQTRMLFSLDGVWQFRAEKDGFVFAAEKPLTTGEPLAVPASFNDQTTSSALRAHCGWFVLERFFEVAAPMLKERLLLRFGSVTHHAEVYVNGRRVAEHKGGFLPFECEIQDAVKVGRNRLTVRFSNLLDYTTLPVGNLSVKEGKNGEKIYKVDENFDFFNYAGIHRPVKLYTTARTYLEDLVLTSRIADAESTEAELQVRADVRGEPERVTVTVLDEDGVQVAEGEGASLCLKIRDLKRWEPLNAYLYTVRVNLYKQGELADSYDEPFGFRTVEVKDNEFLINGRPFYFKGYGKHEDFTVIGRGLNNALNVLDVKLMKWMGANSFRTSHYPYSEEMMRLCDREGIVVIDETTAVGLLEGFSFNLNMDRSNTWEVMKTGEHHREVIRDLIKRDKNHACVVMWSIANEPGSAEPGAGAYFKPLFDLCRELDPQKRPVTYVNIMISAPETDQVAEFCDVLCQNRYFGWYAQLGDFAAAEEAMRDELERWHKCFPDKPIMYTEYGADTIHGFHAVTDTPFTEEYQVRYYELYGRIFDDYPFFIGEQLWNFADFETKFGIQRMVGNRKGVFTRERRPKAAVESLRKRWLSIPNDFSKK